MLGIKRKTALYIKNFPGWTTRKKIVVFSVDDYGNIRLASKQAKDNLKKAGLKLEGNRFDEFDALENKEDLTCLFEILTSVKDKNNFPAVFTAFSVPANIDFEAIISSNYTKYQYELLPDTLNKLPGYEGTWDLWQEGIKKRLIVPQFHGREHLNIKVFNHLLSEKNPELMACIENFSYAGIRANPIPNTSYAAAYSFNEFEENEEHKKNIEDGLNVFEKVFGYRAKNFMAPAAKDHRCLEKTLYKGGIQYIDKNIIENEHQGNGSYKIHFNYLGKKNKFGQTYLIRNSVFEPLLNKSIDSVDQCLEEVKIAFNLGKPAIISTHRVNFAGQIDPKIRDFGLAELKRLLKIIVKKWPEVEFMTADELGKLITEKQ